MCNLYVFLHFKIKTTIKITIMKLHFTILFFSVSVIIFGQNTDLKKDTIQLQEVLIQATRASKKDPFTKSTATKKELEKHNLGQDIPQLLEQLPNVVTTSDTGIGIGYTGIRVRGSDATRVNVTLNGIPFNDSESQGTYWVDLPDFVSSVSSIQLQRGVGTSTNGAGAFGASLSLETNKIDEKSYIETNHSYGSFQTEKHNLILNSGTLKKHFNIHARVSNIKSDGYIDRATSDLNSSYIEANYFTEKTNIKALFFNGSEITYQSWYGIDAETLQNNRTFNPAGAIYDTNGNILKFYDNQVDNYKQDHYQLHFNHKINEYFTTNIAVHYTYGRGFYEQYKQNEDFSDYNFSPIVVNGTTIEQTDLVRQKWLQNDFYGTTFSAKYRKNTIKFIFGGAYNTYNGDHFGKVIWTAYDNIDLSAKFYDNTGSKSDFNLFTKVSKELNKKWLLFADLQYRTVNYTIKGIDEGTTELSIKDQLNFFNPKTGITYTANNKNTFYLSYARANKEPKRADYLDGEKPKPEQLNDFELGWQHQTKKTHLNTNLYYMQYKDQLVLTGKRNDVGTPIAKNIGKSYRIGLELDATIKLGNQFIWQPNFAISQNKNVTKFESINGIIENLGNTDLSYSPNFIAGNTLRFLPNKKINLALVSKYVSSQYMSNIEHEQSKLKGYTTTNLNIQYHIQPKKFVKEIVLTALFNNIYNSKYVSNGYFYSYDDTWSNPNQTTTIYGSGYYPQATFNFLTGIKVKF